MKNAQKSNDKKTFNNCRWFIIGISLFFILFFIAQNLNHRFWMHDFEVYYSAANAYINGDQIYGLPFGLSSGFYKYSPFALLMFALPGMLPFYAAKVLHFIALACLIVVNILLCDKIVRNNFFAASSSKNRNLILFIIFLPLLANIYTELHLGNINTMLLFVFIMALQLLLSGKEGMSGILMALGILLKPHFLIFLPLLLLRKKFRCFAFTLAGITAGLLFPALFNGFGYNVDLHKQWLDIMQMHNSSLIDGQDTLYSWFYRCGGQFLFQNTTRYDKVFGIFVLALISLAILAMIIYHFKNEKAESKPRDLQKSNFIFEYFVLLALVPSITVTDSEHFLFSLPLIAFTVNFLFTKNENIFLKILGIACLILYGMNMRDVVGKDISAALTSIGTLGLANFLIIILCTIIHIRQEKAGYNLTGK